jgi:hypothetical protein
MVSTTTTPVAPKKVAPHQEAIEKTPVENTSNIHNDDRIISTQEQAERDWLAEPKDLLAERAYARAEGKTVAPRAPLAHVETVRVRNVFTQNVALESGILLPGEEGIATIAESSNLVGKYLEVL